MKKRLVMLVLVFMLALAACAPAASTSLPADAGQSPTATGAPATSADVVQATATQAAESVNPAVPNTPVPLGDPMPGCSTISFNPTPEPTLQVLFPAPGPEDWKQGLDTAAVTIVEYGDFQ